MANRKRTMAWITPPEGAEGHVPRSTCRNTTTSSLDALETPMKLKANRARGAPAERHGSVEVTKPAGNVVVNSLCVISFSGVDEEQSELADTQFGDLCAAGEPSDLSDDNDIAPSDELVSFVNKPLPGKKARRTSSSSSWHHYVAMNMPEVSRQHPDLSSQQKLKVLAQSWRLNKEKRGLA